MILTLGAFDGFHRGHRKLLDAAEALAASRRLDWGVATFSCHPQSILGGKGFRYLFSSRERSLIASWLGIPELIEIPFTRTLADLAPERFLDYLEENVPIHGLVVGENFRFGRARTGGPGLLRKECGRRGWDLRILPSETHKGSPISSTRVRERVSAGDVSAAWELMGYPFFALASVVSGDRRGRTLGFPTANLASRPDKILPERGVYAAWALTRDGSRIAAANVGFNPTFEGIRSLRLEAHLLDYEGDLYSTDLILFFLSRVRGELRFEGAEPLKRQMGQDVRRIAEDVRNLLQREAADFSRWEALGSRWVLAKDRAVPTEDGGAKRGKGSPVRLANPDGAPYNEPVRVRAYSSEG